MIPYLPLDVFLLIIETHDCVPERAPVALPPWHATTRSLLALSLVCRAAHPVAMRLLFARCLHVESARRLEALLLCIRQHDARNKQGATLPSTKILARSQSLYLAPFPPDTLDVPSVAADVHELLTSLAPSLRTLVIDMPLRSPWPERDEDQIRPMLRHAFSQLTSLESFCSVRDELYLDCELLVEGVPTNDTPIWSLWSNLQVLALYNLDLSGDYWSYLKQLPALRTLVATRADGIRDVDFNQRWRETKGPSRKLDIYLVNTWEHHHPPRGSDQWGQDDQVAVYEVLVPISYYGDENPITTCQEWEKNVAMRRGLELQDGERYMRSQTLLSS